MKKIIIAEDSFKGCLGSSQVAEAVASGVREVLPDAEIIQVPVADGGEGTVDAIVSAGKMGFSGSAGAGIVRTTVSDPLGRPVIASYGISGESAVIEVAAACGLALLGPEERNPLLTTTRGVGELLLDAIGRGCRKFLVGLGGSATNDGGRGMVEVPGLLEAAEGLEFTAACDVDTPFVGPEGASRVFGPQKGASPEDVELLERRMQAYALKILEDTGTDVRDMPGAGAAGGLGGAFKAYFNASLRRGVDMVLDFIGFDDILDGADLVFTGEGRSDFQTPKGKTPAGGLVGIITTKAWKKTGECLQYGLGKMSGIAILLVGTGTIAGIIKASAIKDVLINLLSGWESGAVIMAPLSGTLMCAASASTTAGATIASSSFAQTILAAGVSAVWAAAMTNAGATVLDHLPHGSFFHATGGSVGMEIKDRLKLIPYETLTGLTLTVCSVGMCLLMG